jgi:hypothetical protein
MTLAPWVMHDLECMSPLAVAVGDTNADRTKQEHASRGKHVMVA